MISLLAVGCRPRIVVAIKFRSRIIHPQNSTEIHDHRHMQTAPCCVQWDAVLDSRLNSEILSMDWFKMVQGCLRENPQETIDVPIKYGAFRLRFSLKPIHWSWGTPPRAQTVPGAEVEPWIRHSKSGPLRPGVPGCHLQKFFKMINHGHKHKDWSPK